MARYQFKFWLDCERDDELMLAEAIDDLKRRRSFVATVRDGIRLILDLRAGRLELLLVLFPWVETELTARAAATEAARMGQQLTRLERLLQQGGGSGPRPMVLQKAGGPVPVDDDDMALVTVRKAQVDGAQITKNFLASMMRLQQ